MTHADLEKWRFRAPLVIGTICALPWFLVSVPELAKVQLLNHLVIPAAGLLIAALYIGFDIRHHYWRREIERGVGSQIRRALIGMVPQDLEITDEERAVLEERHVFKKLVGVFWEAVDRDPILVAQKPHFYSNGVVYSTTLDVHILTAFSAVVYLVAYIFRPAPLVLAVSGFLAFLAIISRAFVLPRVREKHKALSTEQLDLLRRNQAAFVHGRFREIVIELRQQHRPPAN
jgi:hypothetical protein